MEDYKKKYEEEYMGLNLSQIWKNALFNIVVLTFILLQVILLMLVMK